MHPVWYLRQHLSARHSEIQPAYKKHCTRPDADSDRQVTRARDGSNMLLVLISLLYWTQAEGEDFFVIFKLAMHKIALANQTIKSNKSLDLFISPINKCSTHKEQLNTIKQQINTQIEICNP